MPTILMILGWRFFFYANEGNEPIHIHIEKADSYAKFWLDPIRITFDFGFNSKQLREIESILTDNQVFIIEKWNEYFAK